MRPEVGKTQQQPTTSTHPHTQPHTCKNLPHWAFPDTSQDPPLGWYKRPTVLSLRRLAIKTALHTTLPTTHGAHTTPSHTDDDEQHCRIEVLVTRAALQVALQSMSTHEYGECNAWWPHGFGYPATRAYLQSPLFSQKSFSWAVPHSATFVVSNWK